MFQGPPLKSTKHYEAHSAACAASKDENDVAEEVEQVQDLEQQDMRPVQFYEVEINYIYPSNLQL